MMRRRIIEHARKVESAKRIKELIGEGAAGRASYLASSASPMIGKSNSADAPVPSLDILASGLQVQHIATFDPCYCDDDDAIDDVLNRPDYQAFDAIPVRSALPPVIMARALGARRCLCTHGSMYHAGLHASRS